MLGDSIIVAPVVEEGAVSRDIYLPQGKWEISVGDTSIVYEGPTLLQNFRAPLNIIPIFVKQDNKYNVKSVNCKLS